MLNLPLKHFAISHTSQVDSAIGSNVTILKVFPLVYGGRKHIKMLGT